jgi:two-component system, NarL family, response regulator DesR
VIRVLIAEDQAMVRGALASLLSLEDDIEVVAEVERGDFVLEAARRAAPDVALLDIELPGRDGIALAGDVNRELPATRTLILTTFGRPGYLRRALENGADGFLLKDAPAAQLADAIRKVAKGERVIDVQLAADAIAEGPSPLTQREQDVLAAATPQATAADVAQRLHLSEGTVRNYLSAAIRKVGARNRNDARAIAIGKGWIRER